MSAALLAGAQAAAQKHVTPGGANQKASVEGCSGTWLFNGLLRVKVTRVTGAVEPFTGSPGTPGFEVKLQVRNGTHKDVSLSNLGVDGNGAGVKLVMSDDNELRLDVGDFQHAVFQSIPQGGQINATFHFYYPSGTTKVDATPKKFLLQVNKAAGSLRDFGLHYPLSDPSFRVKLDCSK